MLADDLKPRINEFTIDQICALRFAADDEFSDLARKVLNDGTDDRKAIKQMIRAWRA